MKKMLVLSALFLLSLTVFCQNADSIVVAKQVDSLLQISSNFTGKHDFEKALEANDAAEKLALENFGQESAAYGNVCFNHGKVLRFKGDFAGAEHWYLESKAIRQKALGKEHPDYAWSLVSLGLLSSYMGEYEKSESLYLEAIAIQEKTLGKEHPDYATAVNALAVLFLNTGNLEKSEPLFVEAIAIREKVLGKEHIDYAASLNGLAVLFLSMGRIEKSEPLLLQAKDIWGKVLGKKHPYYAASLSNLALLYKDLGDLQKAELMYLESKTILEETVGKEHPDYAVLLNNLANLYRVMGNYEKAESLYQKVNAIREKALDEEHPDFALTLNSMANLYSEMGNYEKAEQFFLKVIVIQEKALGKEHPTYAMSLNNLANLYSEMGNYEKAEQLFLEAMAIEEKALGKEHPDYAVSLCNLASLYLSMGHYQKAEPLYLEAMAIQEKVQGKENPDYVLSLMGLASLYMTNGNDEKAEPLFSELANLNQSQLTKASQHLSEQELNNYLRTFSESQDKTLSFSQIFASKNSISQVCYNNTLFYKGFLLNAANQIKRLALSDTVATEKFNLLKSYERLLAAEYAAPIVERDSANVAELEAKANTLQKDLARMVAGYGEAMRQVKWQEVQQLLRPGEAAIEFVHYRYYHKKLTDSTLYSALILRPGWQTPAWVALGEERQLRHLFFEKQNAAGNSVSQLYAARGIEPDSAKRSFKNLYQFIWRPLDSLLQGAKTVYFSPSGLLHYVNHAAIPIDSHRVLDDRYRLVQVGSTRQLVSSAARRDANNNAMLFGGVRYDMDSTAISQTNTLLPTGETVTSRGYLNFQNTDSTLRGGNWQYLPGTEHEISELEKTLRKTGSTVNISKAHAATEESFKRIGQSAPSPRILHIATHGFFFPDPKSEARGERVRSEGEQPVFKLSEHPMIRSGLLLAGANHAWQTGKPLRPDMEDGILTAYEISQMNLSATELVVLSACETGLGQIQGNEGVYGLQRAFKIAGAKYLIMSLWQVPDNQTSLLMTTFYKKWLEEKMEIPEAFRAAQKEMREQGFDPYQWAGFILVE